MAEVEKILCCDHGTNNDALYGAMLANRNNDPMAMAAMMNGGMGNQWNNPFIYLVWMMFAQRMWGNDFNNNGRLNTAQGIEIQGQLDAIRTQMQDNQNSNLLMDAVKGNGIAIGQLAQNLNCDFNALQGAICDVRGGIDRLSGQVGFSAERVINAVNIGDCNVIQALKDCCCTTQKEILRLSSDIQLQNCQQTNVLQNGQRDLGVALSQGFSQLGYQQNSDKCEIITAVNAAQQKTADLLNAKWRDEDQRQIQDLKNEVSQLKQTQYLANLYGNGCGCGYGVCNQ